MADIFVSYKAEDRRRVRPLVEALQADGFSVWWDEQIGAGDAWRETIEQELDAAKCVIVVWSKLSVGHDGHFVRDEATRAQRRGAYVPVLIDKVEPPLGFGERQAVSMSSWRGSRKDPRYQSVLGSVHAIIERRPMAAHVHGTDENGISRRGAIAGGAVAAASIAAVGAWFLLKPSRSEAARSIAVLPFENLSGDPAQAYFSDGLTEELRTALSRIPQLKVVARTSSEVVRNDDAKTAAQKLGVANILTGSVRRSASLVRVSAQLVDGSSGLERWSQSFDRPLGDVLAIQTNIAESVADALSVQLGESDKALLTLGGTRNPAAHDLLLKGDPGTTDDTEEGLQRAIASLDAAIELDPNYAQAYSWKAMALNYYTGVYAKNSSEMRTGYAEAIAAARKAVSLAPKLAIAHGALAAVLKNELQLKPAFAELQLAARLPGADRVTLNNYAAFLGQLGRFDEALRVASQSLTLDPLNPGSFELQASVLHMAHRFGPAIAAARRSLELGPRRTRARSALGNSLLMAGRTREAEIEFQKLPATDVHGLMGLAVIADANGNRARSDEFMKRIRDLYGDNASYQFAQIYAQRHDTDNAIEALHKAVEVHDAGLPGIMVDPYLDPIRKDPRLADIIRGLNFPT